MTGRGPEPGSGDSHRAHCWDAAVFLDLGLQPGEGNLPLDSVTGKVTAPHAYGMGDSRVLHLGFLHRMVQMILAHIFLRTLILLPDSVRASW